MATLSLQLHEKEREIAELKRQSQKNLENLEKSHDELKKVQNERNDVQVELKTVKTQLKTKDHQNSELQKTNEKLKNELQKRIETLEKENERLSVKITTLETDIEMLKSEIKEEKEENRKRLHELEYKNEKLEGKNQKLNENLQRIELDLKTTKVTLTTENEKLKKTVKQLEITKPIEQSKASLYLGELCWQIQSLIYQMVMPQYHLPKRSYKAKNIVKDIKKWTKTPDEEKEANEKWQELKRILNWNEEQEEAVRILQESRNAEAHPPLDEIDLRESAKVIEREGIYSTALLSPEIVNKLIDMLVKLRQMTND